jgi:sulfhydrogenase subunit gamma (sulfur reductase)
MSTYKLEEKRKAEPGSSIYLPIDCTIVSVKDLTPTEKLFGIQMPEGIDLGHMPGQFIQLSILGVGEAPISISSSPKGNGYFELGIRKTGTLTGAMHEMKVGDKIGIRGPFGSHFDVEKMKGKDLLLISGGCGLAPMRSLIQYCEDNIQDFSKVSILYGAKSPVDMLYKDEIAEWEKSGDFSCQCTVDEVRDGTCWTGNVGLITNLIPPINIDPENTIAVIVGPPVMYKFVIAELAKKGLTEDRIVVSLERYMKCGVGKCGHCTIDHLYCCSDGPVFWLNQVSNVKGAI